MFDAVSPHLDVLKGKTNCNTLLTAGYNGMLSVSAREKINVVNLNVAELFAGAGGLGLGFTQAVGAGKRWRLLFSGEVNPIYVETLKRNHTALSEMSMVEAERLPDAGCVLPIDLDSEEALEQIGATVGCAGDLHALIGGPPCQGFSNANRNSWSSTNPNNRMVEVFINYVERLKPRLFLMENVPGILWTRENGGDGPSAAERAKVRLKSLGYLIFEKQLDAVWYGVPQHRNRFFLLGLHEDLGWRRSDFDSWGPFPKPSYGPGTDRPFVSVKEAIYDLPVIGNGHLQESMAYLEPFASSRNPFIEYMRRGAVENEILDHITSKHEEYVIERYKRIPEGGNWRDIAKMMTNYAELNRTHSNIYRRLKWNEPSITIGHYRKSMLVHPEQHRGLSLREACRLQSFPDWFRFAGTQDGRPGGLMHKQQQLANAVCPLESKAIAEFMLRL